MQHALSTLLVMWVFPALMVYAAMTDLVDRRIANWVSLALIGGYALLALVQLTPPLVVAAHVGIALIAFVVGFIAFSIGQMGGGDVKLITASVLWFGPNPAAIEYVALLSIVGAGVTLVFVLMRLDSAQFLMASNALTRPFAGRDPSGRDIPYGVAIASGALMTTPALAGLHGLL